MTDQKARITISRYGKMGDTKEPWGYEAVFSMDEIGDKYKNLRFKNSVEYFDKHWKLSEETYNKENAMFGIEKKRNVRKADNRAYENAKTNLVHRILNSNIPKEMNVNIINMTGRRK